MEDQYYDIERRTAIKEEARMFRRKFVTYEIERSFPGNDHFLKVQSLVLDGCFGAAFSNPMPSFHPADLLVGLAIGAVLRLAVYMKSKNAKKFRHISLIYLS